jgi:UDP-N-acetylglucosamine acyltransferase
MPTIHPTSILEGNIDVADDVTIGPHCVLDGKAGPIRIGPGSRLLGNVYLTGPLTLGERNTIYPFACLGFSPQDLKWDPDRPGAGLVIGNGNIFRESVTVHRATSDETPTRIGNDNYWMAGSHAGHDCLVGNQCTFVNAALLGGHVQVADRVVVGGLTAAHQFVRLGRGAMLSGGVGLTQDLPPFFMLTAINLVGSINLVGLRRSGASPDMIEDVRWVYRVLYRQGLSLSSALQALRERSDRPVIAEYVTFLEESKRGICTARAKAGRASQVS